MVLFWDPVVRLKQVLFSIDVVIYKFIGYVYDFLMSLAQVQFLDNDVIRTFYYRMYALIGIIMLFRVVFILLNIVINPAGAFHEKEGEAIPMASKVVITVVLILIVPFIFDIAYEIQSVVLREGVIGRIITGVVGETEVNDEVYYKAEKCTYKLIGDKYRNPIKGSDLLLHDLTNDDIIYDLGLPTPTNMFKYLAGSDGIKESRFVYEDGTKIEEDGKRVCSEYAVIFSPRLKYSALVADAGYVYFSDTESIQLALINIPGYNDVKATHQLVNSEPSVGGQYTLTSGRYFGSALLGNFVEPDYNIQVEFREHVVEADFDAMEALANNSFEDGSSNIKYNIILSTITGLAILLLLISSCFDIAVRTIKLSFLQIIAPIPIASYIQRGRKKTDGDIFERWQKTCVNVYLDIFTRVTVLSFISYVLGIILEEGFLTQATMGPDGELIYSGELMGASDWLLQIFIIFGLLLFLKTAPDMINKVLGLNLGENGNMFELNPLKKVQEMPFIGTATGAAMGAVGGFTSGAVTGGFGAATMGLFSGAWNGAKQIPVMGQNFNKNQSLAGGLGQSFAPMTKAASKAAIQGRVIDNATKTINARKSAAAAGQAHHQAAVEVAGSYESLESARANLNNVRTTPGDYRRMQTEAQGAYSNAGARHANAMANLNTINSQIGQLDNDYSRLQANLNRYQAEPDLAPQGAIDSTKAQMDVIDYNRSMLEIDKDAIKEEVRSAEEDMMDIGLAEKQVETLAEETARALHESEHQAQNRVEDAEKDYKDSVIRMKETVNIANQWDEEVKTAEKDFNRAYENRDKDLKKVDDSGDYK